MRSTTPFDIRIAVVFDRLGPYHQARLHAAGREMEVTTVEIAGDSSTYDWEKVDASSQFQRTTLFPETDRSTVSRSDLQAAMNSTLDAISPEVVAVPGWSYPRALAALRWCCDHRIPAVVMSESAGHDFERMWWRERVKRRIVRHFGAGLVGGTPHRAYLRELGMTEGDIFMGYDAVDIEHFTAGAEAVRSSGKNSRDQHSLPDQYFLASGRFVPKKNFPRLIKAFAQYRRRVSSEEGWDLVLLGEGAERDAIEEAIDTEGVRERVHLPGFKQYDELPAYYGLAEAFVHPSTREQWGLVVNEAMAAGLPVIVSERCGCAPDLVDEGRNGFTFDPYDTSELAQLLVRTAHGDVNREQMGAASKNIIAEWGPERFATGLRKAAESALQAGSPSTSLFDQLLMKGLSYR